MLNIVFVLMETIKQTTKKY